MTDTTATQVAPAAGAPLSEHVNTLIDRKTRAYLLGSAEADDARGEGAVVRALLVNAITRLRLANADEYQRRIELGEAELLRREAARPA